MPYAIVIWRRGSNVVDISGLKSEDLTYLEKIPCLAKRLEVDNEGFIRFGPSSSVSSNNCSSHHNSHQAHHAIKPAVVLTGLEVLGFKVVTTTATNVNVLTNKLTTTTTEYSWTLRREFSEPEPQD